MRRTGIHIIGEVPWGTHFCQFYQDKQDLIDILVPYFRAGLENNEFCMWVTSEPLAAEEAKAALTAEVDDVESYIRKGQLEILDYSEWYTAGGKFESNRVLRGWVDRLEAAIARGFDGLRLTGNTFCLEKSGWQDFTEYEAAVDSVIGQFRMLAICTYSLAKCGAVEIMDVVSNHAFALIKRAGKWQIIESAERKKVEANLRESEERLRMAIASTGLGTWDFDPQSGKLVGSDLYKRHLGLSPDAEIDYEKLVRAVHPDDRERVHQVVQMVLKGESGGQYYTEYRTIGIEDGQGRWIVAMGRALFDRGGRPVRFIGTTLDVTERKRVEEDLRRNGEWLRVTLTSIGDAVLATDTAGRVTFLNPVAGRLTGWMPEDALGRPVAEVFKTIDETTRQDAEDIIRRVLHERCVVSMANHTALVARDGTEIPVEDSAAPIRDSAGNVAGVVVVFHDVTERRRTQEALRRRAEEVERLLEAVPAAVWVAQDPQCLTITGNRRANEFYEAEAGENVSATTLPEVRRFFTANGRELPAEELPMQKAVATNQDVRDVELHVQRPSGRPIAMLGSAVPLRDLAGNVRGCIGAFLDITERRRAEEALLQSEDRLRLALDAAEFGVFDMNPKRASWDGTNGQGTYGASARATRSIIRSDCSVSIPMTARGSLAPSQNRGTLTATETMRLNTASSGLMGRFTGARQEPESISRERMRIVARCACSESSRTSLSVRRLRTASSSS